MLEQNLLSLIIHNVGRLRSFVLTIMTRKHGETLTFVLNRVNPSARNVSIQVRGRQNVEIAGLGTIKRSRSCCCRCRPERIHPRNLLVIAYAPRNVAMRCAPLRPWLVEEIRWGLPRFEISSDQQRESWRRRDSDETSNQKKKSILV